MLASAIAYFDEKKEASKGLILSRDSKNIIGLKGEQLRVNNVLLGIVNTNLNLWFAGWNFIRANQNTSIDVVKWTYHTLKNMKVGSAENDVIKIALLSPKLKLMHKLQLKIIIGLYASLLKCDYIIRYQVKGLPHLEFIWGASNSD